ncbi:hypothetical protein JDV02_010696 [Purpureocillium takamizusanense]|uniref:Choline kinase n=1 Tax=Purpureocillium takamizusanense TaxID=2060973 RepID=A0A9Q8QPD8_9HYPO|nr:uncharacterized protein JDV02_010696 [Purpureocillium takamizusanense]UNI24984.1 hypothetical protein JDV02_010696 [Purpureocillium takamizusanense]
MTFGSSQKLSALSGTAADHDDGIVPNRDIWLDKPKPGTDDRESWLSFKNQVISMAQKLGLKGWELLPLGNGDAITVEQITDALTNFIYVVTPTAVVVDEHECSQRPQAVLLRIYGRHVEHLIDRESEFRVLRRLAGKELGPRLLGTFRNGRIEEYFEAAIALRPLDLCEPKASRRIARCLRELHDGIGLLPCERQDGPGVWKNWDQWLEKATEVATFVDNEAEKKTITSASHAWKTNGYVCGTTWTQFIEAVAKYRAYLNAAHGGEADMSKRLVLAHNDVHASNILRMQSQKDVSPLVRADQAGGRMMLIDYEYAGPNTRGYEFANHFREWTYDSHDPVCYLTRYPTREEQRRFIQAYLDHRPRCFNDDPTSPSDPVKNCPSSGSVGRALLEPTFSLIPGEPVTINARPCLVECGAVECEREGRVDRKVDELLEETRLWRPANNAHWVAWAMVQARIPGLINESDGRTSEGSTLEEAEQGGGTDNKFDFLRYAQEHALVFWGDMVQMGLVDATILPDALCARLRIVPN